MNPLFISELKSRQDNVFLKIKALEKNIAKLATVYGLQNVLNPVKTLSICQSLLKENHKHIQDKNILDIVIEVHPSSMPFTAFVLCEQLVQKYGGVIKTYVHSNISHELPRNICTFIHSLKQECLSSHHFRINVIFKHLDKSCRPRLKVDVVKQSPIIGEINIIRYLLRLINPFLEIDDIIQATIIDQHLDEVNFNLNQNDSRQTDRYLKKLDLVFDKNDWLTGEKPCVADLFLWTLLDEVKFSKYFSKNIKNWAMRCRKDDLVKLAISFVSEFLPIFTNKNNILGV